MYDSALRQAIEQAVTRIDTTMTATAPFMAQRVQKWLQQLSGTHQPADYFLHPVAFPMFLLPWWVEKTLQADPNVPFQTDLAYSTANGYYYIRMIDNLMDGDADAELGLLPALNFFHTEFQRMYHLYFAAEHPF
ncbi:MAG: hypothetical protein WCD18_13700, partial [Thermosynechococcaceae cyanobacterium]